MNTAHYTILWRADKNEVSSNYHQIFTFSETVTFPINFTPNIINFYFTDFITETGIPMLWVSSWAPFHLSLVMKKTAFCICENKDADQLRGNREADQRLCFRYIDSTIPLLPKYKNTSL